MMPGHAIATQYLADGYEPHVVADLLGLPLAEVERLVPPRPEKVPPVQPSELAGAGGRGESAAISNRLRTVCMAEVAPEHVEWLWPGYLPLGKLVVLDGDPGVGKSTVMLDVAARLTRDVAMPDGTTGPSGGGGVFLVCDEDGLADTIRPRLDAAGADVSRIHAPDRSIAEGDLYRSFSLGQAGDLNALEGTIREKGVRLVVVDPLMAYLGRANAHHDQDVRSVLGPLAALAERTGTCIVAVRHLNKSMGGNPLYRGGGSIGIVGAARAGLLAAIDPDNPGRRVLALPKHNLASGSTSLGYSLEPVPAGTVARVVWHGPDPRTANDLLSTGHDRPAPREEAAAFLRDQLADGPVTATEIYRHAGEAGISRRTLQRAKDDLGVTSDRTGFAKGATYTWSLPSSMDRHPAPCIATPGIGDPWEDMAIHGPVGSGAAAPDTMATGVRLLRVNAARNLTPWRRSKIDPQMAPTRRVGRPRGRGRGLGP